jgi:hypothetical protein
VRIVLVFALLIGTAEARDYDIPWFQARPSVLKETLRRCHNDYRFAMTAECANAEAAGTRGLGKRLGPPDANGMPQSERRT